MNKNMILGYLVGPIGIGILSLISLPILTWFYSVDDIGKISMLQMTSSLFVLLFCLGLDQAYVREYYEEKNKSILFKMTFIPDFLLGGAILCSIYFFDNTLISFLLYGESNSYLSLVTVGCFLLAFFLRFLSLIVRMQERAFAYSISQILPKLFFLIFLSFSILFGSEQNLPNLVYANLLSLVVACIAFGANVRKSITYNFEWNSKRFKALLAFGLPLVIAGLASWGLNMMDKFFLRTFSSYSELGIYSVTVSIASIVSVFSGVFNTIWTPLVYKWSSQEVLDIQKINIISEHVLAFIYIFIVLSGLLSWTLTYFLPDDYNSVQYIVLLCMYSPLLYTLSETKSVFISMKRKTGYLMIASLVAMCCNVMGNYLLVPNLGALGAGISTAISFWIFYILRCQLAIYFFKEIYSYKAYLITALLLILCILFSVLHSSYFYLIWLIMLAMYPFLFKKTILALLVYFKLAEA